MFGKNLIRETETDGSSLAVQEIFYTLQGEGPFAGLPAIFIRLAGCNLACTFCDTEFESNINNRLPLQAIVAQALTSMQGLREMAVALGTSTDLVVLTGGEPLRQNCVPLIRQLLDAGVKHVQIETAGTLWNEGLEDMIVQGDISIVCSPKTPKIHLQIAQWAMHFKYIIRDGELSPVDGLPERGTQTRNAERNQTLYRPWDRLMGTFNPPPTIWVSPCDEHDAEAWRDPGSLGRKTQANYKAAAQVAMRYGYRLSVQMHKLVGVP